jgi:glycosyltransferase involved in cell wall biosynthesis
MDSNSGGHTYRVCIIRHGHYPSDPNLKRQAETLVRNGYEVDVVCVRGLGEALRETVNKVRVHRLPVWVRPGNGWMFFIEFKLFFLLASLNLFVLYLQRRFDVIEVHTIPDYLVFTALVPKLLGARVVLQMEQPMPELFQRTFSNWYCAPLVPALRLIEQLGINFADGVLTVNREMRQNFGRRGADVNKISVVMHFPDDTMYRPEQYGSLIGKIEELKKQERREGIFRIVCNPGIDGLEGIGTALKAMATLRTRLPHIRLRVLGDGYDVDGTRRFAATLRVSGQVTILGRPPLAETIEEMLAADLALIPLMRDSYTALTHAEEMFPYIVLGKPVISASLEAVRSYFTEESMFFYEPGDDEDLANRIYHVFAHPEEAQRRTENAKEIYETYGWSREAKKYLGVYKGLVGKSSAGSSKHQGPL